MTRFLTLALAASTLLGGTMLAGTAHAQSGGTAAQSSTAIPPVKTNNPVRKPGSAGLVGERTYRALEKVYEQIGNNQMAAAETTLRDLLPRTRSVAAEESEVLRALAHIVMANENYDEAVSLMQRAVELDVLPNRQHFQLMFQIAQVRIVQEKYQEGLAQIDRWMQVTDEIPIEAYELQATAHAQLSRYREALTAIDKAIAMSPNPKDSWYSLKLAMHFELKEYAKAAAVLELLVERNPDNKTYWSQLSAIYINLKEDQKALSVMALAHRRGLVQTEQEYTQLFQLYAYLKIPYKAAQTLDEGIRKGVVEKSAKNWEQLGGSWYEAAELDRALAAYGEAGKLSGNGRIDFQRGSILADQERWEDSRAALVSAIQKGGIDNQLGNALLLLGTCEFNLKDYNAAMETFRQAMSHSNARANAQQWINHINEERERIARRQREAAPVEETDADA